MHCRVCTVPCCSLFHNAKCRSLSASIPFPRLQGSALRLIQFCLHHSAGAGGNTKAGSVKQGAISASRKRRAAASTSLPGQAELQPEQPHSPALKANGDGDGNIGIKLEADQRPWWEASAHGGKAAVTQSSSVTVAAVSCVPDVGGLDGRASKRSRPVDGAAGGGCVIC